MWDGVGGGREVQEEGDIGIPLVIHVDVWEKPTQYCKVIIFQLKINKNLKILLESSSENCPNHEDPAVPSSAK